MSIDFNRISVLNIYGIDYRWIIKSALVKVRP